MFSFDFSPACPDTASCGNTHLIGDNTMFELIRDRLDYHHADGACHDTGYCVEYHVYYNAPEWSKGEWFNVEGLTADGSLVDLLSIGYTYQYPWLAKGTYCR
jgi:hypothetical protein